MTLPPDLIKIVARVQEKRQSFLEYNFGTLKDDALKTSVRTLSQNDKSMKVREAALEALKVIG